MSFKPTEEQQRIIDATAQRRESIMVEADAGAAKTTTMTLAAKAMPPRPALAVAFNKKTATELAERFPPYWQVKTMNGLGYGAWAKKIGQKLKLADDKGWRIITELAREARMKMLEEERLAVKKLVDAARSAGMIHKDWAEQYVGFVADEPEVWQEFYEDGAELPHELYAMARAVLRESTRLAFQGEVDFDDMIYMSVMFEAPYAKFPFVAVDEAQDLNSMNHLQIKRSLQPDGRLLVVGDRKQSIYLFRGAHRESMTKLRELRERWLDFPLHLTFRCPHSVVARQQEHAPGYRAAEANDQGEVHSFRRQGKEEPVRWQGLEAEGWNWGWVKSLKRPGEKIAMVCRNNAPIMGLAFKLLKQGVVPEVLGREIGRGLVALTKKLAAKDETELAVLSAKLSEWVKDERVKAELKGRASSYMALIEDKAECLEVLIDAMEPQATVGALRKRIEQLFAASRGEVTLGSIHKVKGLEYDVVVVVDPWRIPSRWALAKAEATGDEAELKQEYNLKYVAETRTKRVLVEADAEDFREG